MYVHTYIPTGIHTYMHTSLHTYIHIHGSMFSGEGFRGASEFGLMATIFFEGSDVSEFGAGVRKEGLGFRALDWVCFRKLLLKRTPFKETHEATIPLK